MRRPFMCILGTFLYLLQATIMPATSARRIEYCPVLEILCANDDCGRGPEYEFVVRVSGGDSKVKPSYKWSISVDVRCLNSSCRRNSYIVSHEWRKYVGNVCRS